MGKIYFGLSITKDNRLVVVPKSMYFEANKKFRVSDPTQTAKHKWTFTRNNSFVPKDSGTIKWAKYSFKLDKSVFTDTVDFAKEETDIKYVKSIDIDQSGITLTAAAGYTFSADPAKKGDFSVTINKGEKDEYEISYTAKISEDLSVVRINFDKTYSHNSVNSIELNYGTR